VRGAEHDLGAANVHRGHLVGSAGVEGEHRGGVQDRVTALEGAFHRGGVGHVADGRLDPGDTERPERRGDARRRSRQDADPVPGAGQRRDRV
jgi:hypothetical protein